MSKANIKEYVVIFAIALAAIYVANRVDAVKNIVYGTK